MSVTPSREPLAFEYKTTPKTIGKGSYGIVVAITRMSDGAPLIAKISHLAEKIPTLTRKYAENVSLEGRILRHIQADYFVELTSGEHLDEDSGIQAEQSVIIMRSLDPSGRGDFYKRYLDRSRTSNVFRAENCAELLPAVRQLQTIVESKQIIHGDLKPENILPEGVIDFGFAHALDFRDSHALGISKQPLFGTPWYRGPEMWLRVFQSGLAATYTATLSEKYDVWSLGVSIFELITNRPLFPLRDEVVNAPVVYYSFLKTSHLDIPDWMNRAVVSRLKGDWTSGELLERGWIEENGYHLIEQFSLKTHSISQYVELSLLEKERKLFVNECRALEREYRKDKENPKYMELFQSLREKRAQNEAMARALGPCVASMLMVDPILRPSMKEVYQQLALIVHGEG
jgi:serine/threonine protein kinase